MPKAASSTIAAPTSASSTPPATAGDRPRPVRLRTQIGYQARTLTETSRLSTFSGGVQEGRPGDVVISYDNGVVVEVCSSVDFARRYVVDETSGGLHLSDEQLSRLATSLRFGATRNADELVSAVESLALVEIGEVRVHWTPGQIAELKKRADRRGKSYEDYVKLIVQAILDDFFTSKIE